jgi:dTMP kinase
MQSRRATLLQDSLPDPANRKRHSNPKIVALLAVIASFVYTLALRRMAATSMAGTFITFEGIDGSGKSTQLRLLAKFLRSKNCNPVVTREPGGTSVGVRLRAALLDADEQVDPLTELLVFAADRAQHVRRLVRPSLDAGDVVMSDRYADATVAYQGGGRGFSAELISEIVQLATEGLKPHLTLLFDLTVAEAMSRTGRRTNGKHKGDRLDAEDAIFHERVREAYLSIAREEPDRVQVIDSNGTVDETQTRLRSIVVPFLRSRGHWGESEATSAASKPQR